MVLHVTGIVSAVIVLLKMLRRIIGISDLYSFTIMSSSKHTETYADMELGASATAHVVMAKSVCSEAHVYIFQICRLQLWIHVYVS